MCDLSNMWVVMLYSTGSQRSGVEQIVLVMMHCYVVKLSVHIDIFCHEIEKRSIAHDSQGQVRFPPVDVDLYLQPSDSFE